MPFTLIDFLERNWYLVILGYYALFTAGTFGTYKRIVIFEGGKLRLKEVGRWLAFAWTIPTLFVLVGLVGSLILAGLGTSGECHPSHGWACETPPDFTFTYYLSFFKGGIAWVQVAVYGLLLIVGTIYLVGLILELVGKKCYPSISKASKKLWERLPIRW